MRHACDVLLLTRLIGRDVLGLDGRVSGRLADLTVRLNRGSESHLVERLVVTRRHDAELVLPWTAVRGHAGHHHTAGMIAALA